MRKQIFKTQNGLAVAKWKMEVIWLSTLKTTQETTIFKKRNGPSKLKAAKLFKIQISKQQQKEVQEL